VSEKVLTGLLWALAGASTVLGLGLVPLIATSSFLPDHGFWIVVDLVIGGGFTAVGLFAWYRRPDNRVGALMVATAFAWYAVVASNTEPSLLWTFGTVLNNLFAATAIHLLLAFPSGRLETAVDRVLVGVGYVATTIGWVPLVLFTDPADFGCANCPENLLLIDANAAFRDTWLDGLNVVGLALMLTVLARLVQRWRNASAPLRRAITPVFLAGGALLVALGAVLAAGLFEAYGHSLHKNLFYGCLVAFGLVPYVFLAGLLRGRWIRGRGLGALVRWLGQPHQAGELREELARALGDPSVELAYWLPESEQHVDAEGHPVELPSGRAVTPVERDGRRIAAIIHDPALLDDPDQVHAAGTAAALALENARLEAELRAKVEEVRASRSRLVEVGLSQRRRLERDLHDGAQQRLVSLALTLRMAREKLGREPRETERLLDRSREELNEALQELRELARGIHPAVLSDRGLEAAVEALAHRAHLPVELGEFPVDRVPEHVELAAYFVISEALTNVAKYASASQAKVAVSQSNGRLTVEVSDDGIGGADPELGSGLRGLAARLEAIEGRIDIDSEPGHGTTVRASIPWDHRAPYG
jgi:signal transduction histidine kinase